MRDLPTLIDDLDKLCTCDGETEPFCIFCEAGIHLEAQQRTIDLFSARADRKDRERIEFLERWVANSRARGYKWDTFTFNNTGRSARDQLDEQMAAGMVELQKSGHTSKAE